MHSPDPEDFTDTLRRWLDGDFVLGVTFALNDPVRIRDRSRLGQLAAVVSIARIGAEPVYVVELASDGTDIEVAQSLLEHAT